MEIKELDEKTRLRMLHGYSKCLQSIFSCEIDTNFDAYGEIIKGDIKNEKLLCDTLVDVSSCITAYKYAVKHNDERMKGLVLERILLCGISQDDFLRAANMNPEDRIYYAKVLDKVYSTMLDQYTKLSDSELAFFLCFYEKLCLGYNATSERSEERKKYSSVIRKLFAENNLFAYHRLVEGADFDRIYEERRDMDISDWLKISLNVIEEYSSLDHEPTEEEQIYYQTAFATASDMLSTDNLEAVSDYNEFLEEKNGRKLKLTMSPSKMQK